ncbi:unnamed protein product [Camellia sinensis]
MYYCCNLQVWNNERNKTFEVADDSPNLIFSLMSKTLLSRIIARHNPKPSSSPSFSFKPHIKRLVNELCDILKTHHHNQWQDTLETRLSEEEIVPSDIAHLVLDRKKIKARSPLSLSKKSPNLQCPLSLAHRSPLPPLLTSVAHRHRHRPLSNGLLISGPCKQGWRVRYEGNEWDSETLKVFVVPHSHNDPGWKLTVEEYYDRQSRHILDTISRLFRRDPRCKFIWEEMSYLERWWKDASETKKESFINLVKNAQLEIVGGGWVMNDEMEELMKNQMFATHAVAAAGSVTLGTALTYPLDTIKVLIQLTTAQVLDRVKTLSGHAGLYSGFGWLMLGRILGAGARFVSSKKVTVDEIKAVMSEEHKETMEQTYDIYLLPPGEDPESCQSYLRMRNKDGKYNLMFEEWVTDSPFVISPRITFEVSVRLLGGLMALGYTIAAILKRSSHVFSDERVCVKIDWLEQLNRHYVRVQGKDRLLAKYVAEQLELEGSYVPRTYLEQIQLEKLVDEVMALPDDLKTKLSMDDDLVVASPKEALS